VHAEVTADELGTVADIFNSILANLRYLVSQVAETAVQVNSSVCENDGFIHQISEQIFTQSSDIANALNSIEQMARSLQAVTDSATELTVVAQTACSTAEAGRKSTAQHKVA
jgi:methyl-accepting chemotaxis protein